MKILLTSQHCFLGGAERFMLALRSGLQRDGHQCELFFFQHGQFEQHLPACCVAHFGDLRDCMKLVKDQRFDIVHARTSDWETGLSAIRRRGVKLILTSHGFVEPGWNSANSDAIVTCSRWLAQEQQVVTDIPVRVVLNGIDTATFSPTQNAAKSSPPIVAWVGRGIDPRKRIDTFAALSPSLHSAGMRLWVVDPYGHDAVKQVNPEAAATLRRTADFWGPVAVERMPALYRDVAASGGCVVSTATWEGLPLTLLEAQGCGCPVIGPDVRGTNECVDPAQGGILYPLDMPVAQLSALVLDTVRDSAGLQSRGQACARLVREKFSVGRMAQDYLRIYREAPYPRRGTYLARRRTRLLLSPLRNWDAYVAHRWSAGTRQYETARTLAQRGEWKLARRAARASLVTSPTIYLKPNRMALLLRTHLPRWRTPLP